MQTARTYDSELQMFREAGREPRLAELSFLRWLADQGRLEQAPVGPPAGRYAERLPAARRQPRKAGCSRWPRSQPELNRNRADAA